MYPANISLSVVLPMQAAPCRPARTSLDCPAAGASVLGRNRAAGTPTLPAPGRIANS